MSDQPYSVGDTIRLLASFSINGFPFDPAFTACKMKQPNGPVIDVSPSIVRIDQGNYIATFTAALPGTHTYEWNASSGGSPTVTRKSLYVNSAMPGGKATNPHPKPTRVDAAARGMAVTSGRGSAGLSGLGGNFIDDLGVTDWTDDNGVTSWTDDLGN